MHAKKTEKSPTEECYIHVGVIRKGILGLVHVKFIVCTI